VSATKAGKGHHTLAWSKPRDVRRTLQNFAGKFQTRHEWQIRFNLILALDHQNIGKIDTGCLDGDANFTTAELRRRNVA